jgi:predicted thioesterase
MQGELEGRDLGAGVKAIDERERFIGQGAHDIVIVETDQFDSVGIDFDASQMR